MAKLTIVPKSSEEMEPKSNVIEFPGMHVRPEIISPQIKKYRKLSNQKFANDATADLSDSLFEMFGRWGLDTDTEEFRRDFSFLYDAICASVYRACGIKHPFHPYLNASIKVEHPDGGVTYENEVFINIPKHKKSKKTANSGPLMAG